MSGIKALERAPHVLELFALFAAEQDIERSCKSHSRPGKMRAGRSQYREVVVEAFHNQRYLIHATRNGIGLIDESAQRWKKCTVQLRNN